MKVLVTGSAGFIGSAVSIRLLERGDIVFGIDNHNDYYDPALKEARLSRHKNHKNYVHIKMNIENSEAIAKLFEEEGFDCVVNLAAQAGVRHSIENPLAYINTNLVGFSHILEGCRNNKIKHLVYASSSSVYGLNTKQPFSTHNSTNHPISLYAATKKANELLAHTYSHLYNIPTTGLRFFTVYGPYDRPDMALQKFTRDIINGKPINIYNFGKHRRDFTYIDDIVEGIIRVIDCPARPVLNWDSMNPDPATSSAPYKIFNIGNNNPVELMDYINALENSLGKIAKKNLLPLQPGDVVDTYADVDDLVEQFDYKPSMAITEGINNFVAWYLEYNKIKKA
ncbi:NAD-dependent epimerase [Candidatus Pseudothioglobus singularis]|nr:NAD-dependent epimerase [Candidatus Pseudothioglobus singularis]